MISVKSRILRETSDRWWGVNVIKSFSLSKFFGTSLRLFWWASSRFEDHISTLSSTKQVDSKSPWVCTVIDHRWHQNVRRTRKWCARRNRVMYYHIMKSSVIYYFIDVRRLRMHLFYVITKQSVVSGDFIYASVLYLFRSKNRLKCM